MTREEQLEYCKICLERKFDKQRGIICSLTDNIASFESECLDFKKDNVAYLGNADDEEIIFSKDIKSIISSEKYQGLIERQNLPGAIISGIIVALLCSITWAILTIQSGLQIGIMAIGIGAAVGFVVRYFGNGIEPIFSIIGASFALLSCIIGNLLSIIGILANDIGVTFFEALSMFSISELFGILFGEWLDFVDFVFYGIAALEGFKFSLIKITEKSAKIMNQI